MSRFRWLAAGLVLVAAGCEEDLTVPGKCPDLCLGGTPQVRELLLPARAASDSSFFGYAGFGDLPALLLSNGIAAGEARAWYRFPRRSDSVGVGTEFLPYTVDSVALVVPLVARDSTVTGLWIHFHRIPYETDSLATFAELDAALGPESLIDSVAVPDTLRRGNVRLVLSGEDLGRLVFAPEDSGRLAIGFRMRASEPTGVRLGSVLSSTGPATFTTFARVEVSDTARQRQTISLRAEANGFVTSAARVVNPDLLYVGGLPAARTLLRFEVPRAIFDSSALVRATLELVPAEPLYGVRNDAAALEVRGVTSDLGAKSTPVFSFRIPQALPEGTQDTVRVDVANIVNLWAGANPLPQVLYLSLAPEAGSFHQPVFFSTRSAQGAPRLRITYLLPAPVERP
jgi:hypothetical protein